MARSYSRAQQLALSAARRHGVDPYLALSVLGSEGDESNGQTSPAGAAGAMQLMPATARALGLRVDGQVDERRDLAKNIDAGVRYLAEMGKRYGGDVTLTAIAYNGGPGAVAQWQRGQPYGESRAYVRNVTAAYRRFAAEGASDMDTPTSGPTRVSAPRPTAAQQQRLDGLKKQLADAQATLAAAQNSNLPKGEHEAGIRAAQGRVRTLETAVRNAEGSIARAADGSVVRQPPRAGQGRPPIYRQGPDGRTYRVDPDTNEATPVDGIPPRSGGSGGGITPYQQQQLEDADVRQQLQAIKTAVDAGQLRFDQAKYATDKILGLDIVEEGGKFYKGGLNPGNPHRAYFGIAPEEANGVDIAGMLERGELNENVLSGPYKRLLEAHGIKTGPAAKMGRLANTAADKLGSAPADALAQGTEPTQGFAPLAGAEQFRNGVNPAPGEVSRTPLQAPVYGSQGQRYPGDTGSAPPPSMRPIAPPAPPPMSPAPTAGMGQAAPGGNAMAGGGAPGMLAPTFGDPTRIADVAAVKARLKAQGFDDATAEEAAHRFLDQLGPAGTRAAA